jgi:hypothetical protein
MSARVVSPSALCLRAFALKGPCFIREIREIRGSILRLRLAAPRSFPEKIFLKMPCFSLLPRVRSCGFARSWGLLSRPAGGEGLAREKNFNF